MINFRNFFSSILVVLILSGCSPYNDPIRSFAGSYRNYYNTTGKVSNGRYYAPNKVFSVEIPKLFTPGAIVEDRIGRSFGRNVDDFEAGIIRFLDDFGTYIFIDVLGFPQNDDLIKRDDKDINENTKNYMLSLYQKNIPETKIVKQEVINWNNRKALYFVAEAKEASNVSINGVRLDEFRGAITFVDGRYVYIFSSRSPKESILKGRNVTEEQIFKDMKEYIMKTMNTFEANPD